MKAQLTSILIFTSIALTFAQVEVCEPAIGAPCADGAFRESTPRACDIEWSYRVGDDVQIADADGCLSITEFPPFGHDSLELVEPRDARTDKSRWCSFKQNKNKGAGNKIHDLKNSPTTWGYCLSVGGSGSNSSATEAPSPSSGATDAPTPLSLPAGDFLADGAFQDTPIACDEDWTYEDADGKVSGPFTGCVNGDSLPPVGWKSAGLKDPKDGRTNTSLWCSVKQAVLGTANAKYDVNPGTDFEEKTQAWGFCLDTSIVAVTSESPTTTPETLPTASPVGGPSPTGSPTTESTSGNVSSTPQPSVSTTSAPTDDVLVGTESPTMGSGGNGTTPAPNPSQGLSSGEVAAAVIVPLIVVFGAIGGFAYYKYSSLNESGGSAGAGYAEAGTGEPETAKAGMDTGKPVTEATEGKKNADEILLG